MKKILRGSAVIFGFKVLGAVSLFMVHILISRYYGAEMLGVFNLVLALMMASAIFSKIGLDMYIVRMIPSIENQYTKISLFLKEVFKIILFCSTIVSTILYLLSDTIDAYIFKSVDASNYLLGLVLITIPFAYFNVLPEVFRAFHDVKIYSFFRNLSQNFFLLLFLIFAIYANLKFDPIYMLYSAIAVATFLLVFVLFKFLKKYNIYPFIRGKFKDKILINAYPMFLTSSMMFLMGYVDSFMISYYLDEYQVGIYSACIKLSFAITFILASVNGFIAPKISQAYSKGDNEEVKVIYKNSVKLIFISTAPIFIFLYLYPEYFLGLFGKEFKAAASTLIIVNTAFLINAISGSVGYVLNMTDNQHIFMKILSIGLLLNIVLNALLIPQYQINGAAIATLVSMTFWNIGSVIILKKKKII
jgi:O-antigen/teichoic acid export membrane protein